MLKFIVMCGVIFTTNIYAGCCVTDTGVCCQTGCSRQCVSKTQGNSELEKLLVNIDKDKSDSEKVMSQLAE